MGKNSVNMGYNYNDDSGKLVRTVCRAYTQTGDSMIAYVNIDKGGYASDVYLMEENEFNVRFNV